MRACPRCGETYDDGSAFCPRDGAELDAGAGDTLAFGSGARVLGSYRLVRMLGEGGMGRVFLAEHVKLGRRVALKMLRPEFAANAEAVRRFFAEARAVNQVAHPNIVAVTDFFEADGAGQAPYLIMEYLEGESLRALLDREPVPDLLRTITVCLQLADALAAVHAAGIVHRDLKPDNVFLVSGRQDQVKILDFGIAKLRSPGDGRSMLHTAHGAVLGTPEYMSPEQAEATLRVDHRADVYALGVILYEMVSGKKPIVGNTISETLIKQLTWTPPLPSEATLDASIPAELEELIMRCLEKAADRRPRDMREVESALRNVQQRLSGGVTSPSRMLHLSGQPSQGAAEASAATILASTGTSAGTVVQPAGRRIDEPTYGGTPLDSRNESTPPSASGVEANRAASRAPAQGGGLPPDVRPAKGSNAGLIFVAIAALAVAVGGTWYLLSSRADGVAEAGDETPADPARTAGASKPERTLPAAPEEAAAGAAERASAVDPAHPVVPSNSPGEPRPAGIDVDPDAPGTTDGADAASEEVRMVEDAGEPADSRPTMQGSPQAPRPAGTHAAPAPAPAVHPAAPVPAAPSAAPAPAAGQARSNSGAPAPAGSAVHAPRPATSPRPPARGAPAPRPASR